MACSDVYPTAGGYHHEISEVQEAMVAELISRACPRCECPESRPVEGDAEDREGDEMTLRVCAACDEVFGFDDSTLVPDHLLPGADTAAVWEDHANETSLWVRDADAGDVVWENDDWKTDHDLDQRHQVLNV